jgi:hypothetical protein
LRQGIATSSRGKKNAVPLWGGTASVADFRPQLRFFLL